MQLIFYVQIRYTRLFFSFVQDQTKLLPDKKKEVIENTTAENQVMLQWFSWRLHLNLTVGKLAEMYTKCVKRAQHHLVTSDQNNTNSIFT